MSDFKSSVALEKLLKELYQIKNTIIDVMIEININYYYNQNWYDLAKYYLQVQTFWRIVWTDIRSSYYENIK